MIHYSDVGVIGAGVSGVVVSLELAKYKIPNILFEKQQSVVSGPPFCHLHAGGNLYPDISIEQCKILLKQSIEMARLFPQSIDERPTLISIPTNEQYSVEQITDRLDEIVAHYNSLIQQFPKNKILGEPENYFRVFSKEKIDELKLKGFVQNPNSLEDWLINALQVVNIKKLKTPLIIVQEYGWNLFRLGAQAQIALQSSVESDLLLNTQVTDVKDIRKNDSKYNWEITANGNIYQVKYLVNACGYKTGEIDEEINVNTERFIEFKAAYVSKWSPLGGPLPELIFHGKRGTPHGMAQLTPYPGNYYQIHGMTKDITLFKKGLVEADDDTVQPEFRKSIHKKLEYGWDKKTIQKRTRSAINYIANFVPNFYSAQVGGPPLFGAQQIPGDDPDLRVGEVSFNTSFYARSEIVKASSALTVANQILEDLEKHMVIKPIHKIDENPLLKQVSKIEIDSLAEDLASQRGYPKDLAHLVIKKD